MEMILCDFPPHHHLRQQVHSKHSLNFDHHSSNIKRNEVFTVGFDEKCIVLFYVQKKYYTFFSWPDDFYIFSRASLLGQWKNTEEY